MSHRVSNATNFLAVAATSSDLHNQRLRQSAVPIAKQRSVHTTLIDAGWDQAERHTAQQTVTQQPRTIPPQTSIIDAEWDPEPVTHVAQRSGEHRLDTFPLPPSPTDSEWPPPSTQNLSHEYEQVVAHARQRLLAIVDAEEDLDPVITYFELDGPECLGLLEGELD
jgi:hypothetical protein